MNNTQFRRVVAKIYKRPYAANISVFIFIFTFDFFLLSEISKSQSLCVGNHIFFAKLYFSGIDLSTYLYPRYPRSLAHFPTAWTGEKFSVETWRASAIQPLALNRSSHPFFALLIFSRKKCSTAHRKLFVTIFFFLTIFEF